MRPWSGSSWETPRRPKSGLCLFWVQFLRLSLDLSRRSVRAYPESGTLCTAEIVVDKQRPLSLAIPVFKRSLGVE